MPDAPAVTPVAEGTVPWPEEAVREYVARGWWRGRALGTELWSAADARPGAPAVIDGAVRLTYRSVTVRADALAAKLTDDLGLRRGDRIVVQLPNCWQFVILLLGCLRAGIIPVMALPAHRRHELAYLVGHSEAVAIAVPGLVRDFDHRKMAEQLVADCPTLRVVLTTSEIARAGCTDLTALCAEPAQADGPAARRRWDADPPGSREVALFLLSGGTTGLPKLIARTHDDYAYNARASAALCGLGAGHGLPDGAAGVAQLPAGLPGHPGHPAVRRPRRHAAVAGARAILRRHRRRGGHRHRRRARGRAAVDQARPGTRRRPACAR